MSDLTDVNNNNNNVLILWHAPDKFQQDSVLGT